MKSPPIQHPDDICRNMTEAFIAGTSNAAVAGSPGRQGARHKKAAAKKAAAPEKNGQRSKAGA